MHSRMHQDGNTKLGVDIDRKETVGGAKEMIFTITRLYAKI